MKVNVKYFLDAGPKENCLLASGNRPGDYKIDIRQRLVVGILGEMFELKLYFTHIILLTMLKQELLLLDLVQAELEE